MAQLEKWVVLIGIDFYVDHRQRLKGCVNDVKNMRLYFERNYSPVKLTVFEAVDTNDPSQNTPSEPSASWPTYDNITGALKQITASASPGAYVYIHYSGHGTSTPTTAKYRENSEMDSALVLFDIEKGARYLRGIELASLLDDMLRRELRLTVVLDCCSAGGISRSSESTHLRIRGVPWDYATASAFPINGLRSSATEKTTGRTSRDASTKQHWLLRPREYTLIAACGPHEIAGECEGKDGRIHGALSYFLFAALTTASNNGYEITCGSLYRQICAKFHVPLPEQHPILFGNNSTRIMGPEIKTQGMKPTCSVIKAADGKFWLNVGCAHGVGLGDEYTVYPVEDLSIETSRKPKVETEIKIKAIHALSSEAEQVQLPREGSPIKIGWHATLLTPFRLKAQVQLYSEASLELRDAITKSLWLRVANEDDAKDVTPVTILSFRVRVNEKNEFVVFNWAYHRILNLPTVSASGAETTYKIVAILEHLAMFANIENLDNESSDALLESDFSIDIQLKDNPSTQLSGNSLEVEDNGKLLVIFQNRTNKPLNLTVLDMGPRRGVSKLYPSMDRGDWKVILPKQVKDGIDVTGQISFTVKMTVPSILKADVTPRIEDVLKFFITTRPTSFASLEIPALSAEAIRKERSSNHKLFNFLQSLRTCHQPDVVLRDGDRMPGDRWACRNFTIHTTTTPSTAG